MLYYAKFISSIRNQYPFLIAYNKTPSHQLNFISSSSLFAMGYSDPSKSIMSVCSLKLTLINVFPVYFAKFSTKDVFPTPGGPSISTGLPNVKARNNFIKFVLVVSASNA